MLEGLGLLLNALILVIALAALTKASDLTITQSINVASVTGLGKTTVGFILVAFSTSLPELFVAVFSVLNPDNIGVSIGKRLGFEHSQHLFDTRHLLSSNISKVP